MKNAKAKGSRNERRARKQLEAEGFYVVKAGGSLGLFDLVCFNREVIRLVQVKSNRTPGRVERERLEAFKNYPKNCTRREVWIYRDRVKAPAIGVL